MYNYSPPNANSGGDIGSSLWSMVTGTRSRPRESRERDNDRGDVAMMPDQKSPAYVDDRLKQSGRVKHSSYRDHSNSSPQHLSSDLGPSYQEPERKIRDPERNVEHYWGKANTASRISQKPHTTERHIRTVESQLKQELALSEQKLRHVESQLAAMRKLLEEKTADLQGAQAFVDQADSLSGANVTAKLNSLNDEILQCCALMAFSLKFSGQAPQDNQAVQAARGIIGDEMVDALTHQFDDGSEGYDLTSVQLALQTCLTWCCWHISTSWTIGEPDAWVKKLYAEILSRESQVVAGRWRMMTRSHIGDVKDPKMWMRYIVNHVSSVLIVAGCQQTKQDDLRHGFEERLSMVANLAVDLQTAMGEHITSMDIESYIVAPKTEFNEEVMENDGSGDIGQSVVATSQLGLRRRVDGSTSKFVILAKAKVFFQSAIQD